jgi:hypothetical protein
VSRRRARYPYRPVRDALWRGFWWLVRAALCGAAAVAIAPVTLAACAAFWYAWRRGHPPRRVFAGAACCLPMVAAWLGAVACWPDAPRAAHGAGAGHSPVPAGVGPGALWFRVAAAPYRAWAAMWPLLAHGHPVAAAVAVAAPAVPLGIAAGGAAWAYRRFRMRTGAGGLTPESPAAFDARQWRHQVRTAQALIAAPGSLPLLSRSGHVVVGAAIRTVRHRAGRAAAIPYERLRAHQVVIGSTGTGKTTLLLRLWAGFMAAGLRRYAAGTGRRPLLVVLDCKGGASSRKVADRTRRVLRDAGARSTAIWPDEAALSLWALPPDRLVTTLLDLIEHGTGGAAYYTDVMEALVELAVYAPCGPPASSADFLARLDADWLAAGYAVAGDGEAVSVIRSGRRALEDVRLRFRALWRRLGAGLDGTGFGGTGLGGTGLGGTGLGGTGFGGTGFGGGGSFADADAWYCVLEGTAEVAVAEAQARALTDLLAFHALRGDREILLCVDEFSAVARRLPIWRLYERARSLGLAVQVSAQSWEGLAGSDDERWRVAATAEGGIWLLRTPRPSPVVELAGTRPSVDTSRRMSGAGPWDGEGLSRAGPAPVLDGDLVRRLEVGQVCYVYRNGVTFLQIKRLTGRQAAIGHGSAAAGLAGAAAAAGGAAVPGGFGGVGGPGGVDGTGGEPPTVPFAAVPGAAPWAAPVAGGRGRPGVPVPVPALSDVSEVLDEAFGERRG